MKKFLAFIMAISIAVMFVGCGKSQKSTDLTKVMKEMEEKVSLDNMMDLTKEDLFDYYGIVEDDIVQFAAKINDSGVKADEIVMVEAKDTNAAQRIKEKLDGRYQSKINENTNYNQEALEVIQKCKVDIKGNYVSMLVSPEVETLEKIYNNSFK